LNSEAFNLVAKSSASELESILRRFEASDEVLNTVAGTSK